VILAAAVLASLPPGFQPRHDPGGESDGVSPLAGLRDRCCQTLIDPRGTAAPALWSGIS